MRFFEKDYFNNIDFFTVVKLTMKVNQTRVLALLNNVLRNKEMVLVVPSLNYLKKLMSIDDSYCDWNNWQIAVLLYIENNNLINDVIDKEFLEYLTQNYRILRQKMLNDRINRTFEKKFILDEMYQYSFDEKTIERLNYDLKYTKYKRYYNDINDLFTRPIAFSLCDIKNCDLTINKNSSEIDCVKYIVSGIYYKKDYIIPFNKTDIEKCKKTINILKERL